MPHEYRKCGAIYLELLNDKLRTIGLEGITTKIYHVLTLESFPDSYMLLISISSTPISCYRHLVINDE